MYTADKFVIIAYIVPSHLTNECSKQLTVAHLPHHLCTYTTDSDEPKRKEKRQKGGKSGFLAPIQLSDALTNFLGTGENALSRSDVIKRMWDYIKGNNLQVCRYLKLLGNISYSLTTNLICYMRRFENVNPIIIAYLLNK